MRRVVVGIWACLALAGGAWAEDSPYKTILDDGTKAWVDPDPKATEAQKREATEYVLGNTLNTMFHEFGHAMVSEFDINVLGKEEDAVDSFANVTMIADEKDPILDAMMIAVVRAWFDQGTFDSGLEIGDLADEHSMNEQRGYATVCQLYGASPERFGKIAEEVNLPEERREGCEADYVTAYNSWLKALGDNYMDEGEEPKNLITIKWDEPTAELKPVADMLKASHLMEAVVEQMEYTFRLPHPITVSVTNCEEENAFWSAEDRTLTLCYEIADGYRNSAIERRSKGEKPNSGEAPPDPTIDPEPAAEPEPEPSNDPTIDNGDPPAEPQ